MKIYINDLTGKVKELNQIENQAKSIMSYLKLPSSTEVSISFIDDSYMRELNLKYRDNNRTTDVLSFPQEGELLGDILISVDKATAQSEELGHTFGLRSLKDLPDLKEIEEFEDSFNDFNMNLQKL